MKALSPGAAKGDPQDPHRQEKKPAGSGRSHAPKSRGSHGRKNLYVRYSSFTGWLSHRGKRESFWSKISQSRSTPGMGVADAWDKRRPRGS